MYSITIYDQLTSTIEVIISSYTDWSNSRQLHTDDGRRPKRRERVHVKRPTQSERYPLPI